MGILILALFKIMKIAEVCFSRVQGEWLAKSFTVPELRTMTCLVWEPLGPLGTRPLPLGEIGVSIITMMQCVIFWAGDQVEDEDYMAISVVAL